MDLGELCKELPEKLSEFIKTALNERKDSPFYKEMEDDVKKYLTDAVKNPAEIKIMELYNEPQTLLTYIVNIKNNIAPCFNCKSLLPAYGRNYCTFCGAETIGLKRLKNSF